MSVSSSPRALARLAAAGRATLLLAAVAQLALAGAWLWQQAPAIVRGLGLSTDQEPPSGEAMQVFVALPKLLQNVPADAPVLVVSTLVAAQFEYYVLPRPMRLLQALPDEWIALAQQHAPYLVDEVRRRRQRLDDRGALLTAARVSPALDAVRFVLVAGPTPAELEPVRARLAPVAEQPGFALFAVR